MSLYREQDQPFSSDYNYEDSEEDFPRKKKIRRMLEEKLESKRLYEECKDDFDFEDDFDWSDWDNWSKDLNKDDL